MPVIVIVSGKASPGATTSAAALAWAWPSPVVLADCDPVGGDLTAGWLSPWVLSGWLRRDIGVLSFATATRHDSTATAESLTGHLQAVPGAPNVRVLIGLAQASHAASVGELGWRRLAEALAETDADAIVDCGRLGPSTPWPLVWGADLVLVAVRPLPRHVIAARAALAMLRRQVEPARLELLACAARASTSSSVEHALDVSVRAELPEDHAAASVFSDGMDEPLGLSRSLFARSARTAATRLAAVPVASSDREQQAEEVGSDA